MIEKIHTLFWFAKRPSFWPHAIELARRKFRANHDGPEAVETAKNWAAKRAVPIADALKAIGLPVEESLPEIPPALLAEGAKLGERSDVIMGGAGDLSLLHAAIKISGAKHIIETGVAYGWSSLAILSAINDREGAQLISVDMPYPKAGNEPFVGIVVPEQLRKPWKIIRQPDRPGLKVALKQFHQKIDFCHYDSDKSWWGRQYAYPLLWAALSPGGLFISDDIQDNMMFAKFAQQLQAPFAVTHSDGKYVGIIRKQ